MRLARILMHVKRFVASKDGASGIEYAVIAGMVALAIIAVSTDLSTAVQGTLNAVKDALNAANTTP